MMRNLLLPVALLSALLPCVAWAQPDMEREQACVVLLHGLFRSAAAMKPLEWYLENEGYATVNESYRSLSAPIEELSEEVVGEGLRVCRSMGFARVHFVAHSMGGILIRQYASIHALPHETRVVMLGPPNQGSPNKSESLRLLSVQQSCV